MLVVFYTPQTVKFPQNDHCFTDFERTNSAKNSLESLITQKHLTFDYRNLNITLKLHYWATLARIDQFCLKLGLNLDIILNIDIIINIYTLT